MTNNMWYPSTCPLYDKLENGDLSSAKRLLASGLAWHGVHADALAGSGHIRIMQWALDNGHSVPKSASQSAAQADQLDVLIWMIDKGIGIDDFCLDWAAMFGYEEMFKWLVENGHLPSDEHACCNLAAKKNIGLLQWAIEHGCVCDYKTIHDESWPRNLTNYMATLNIFGPRWCLVEGCKNTEMCEGLCGDHAAQVRVVLQQHMCRDAAGVVLEKVSMA